MSDMDNREGHLDQLTLGQNNDRRLSTMSPAILPILSVLPTRTLADETLKVVVDNLPPGSPVTLHALHHSEDKDYWEAYGHYVSDHRGVVSAAEDLSFGGTYTGKEPMGLVWSMRPIQGSRTGLRLRKMNVCIPMLFNISVYGGHIAEGFREQTPLASTLIERWHMAPGVKRVSIKERGVRGTLFIPPGPGPFPGLLDMWGGGGGLLEYRSALLASHGYVSFALKYFSPGELESTDLQFKYFETAFNVVKDHPQVIPDRVGIFGLSLGSIIAINLAADSTLINASLHLIHDKTKWLQPLPATRLVKSPEAIFRIGNHSYVRGDSIDGIQQFVDTVSEKARTDEDNNVIWRGVGEEIVSNSSKKVNVGKINCPMLLINGCDDQNWPTVEGAEDMARMMNVAGKGHLLTSLKYPDTGHLIEPPFSPHFRATNFILATNKQKVIMLWGGQTKPHSDAQEDSWKKILAFLQHHLYSRFTLSAKM